MDRRQFLTSAGATALGGLSVTSLASPVHAQSRKETLLVVSESGPNSLDLMAVGANVPSYEVAWNCYDRLISHELKRGENGAMIFDRERFKPELAEDIKKDDMSVTFRLRKDALFHDGTPVTAKDVKWSLDRAVQVGGFPTFQMKAGSLEKPEQFVVVDDHTIRVDYLRKDRLTMPDLAVAVPSIMNSNLLKKHATASDPWALEFGKQNTAGGGAYRVTQWTPGSELIFERNDRWKSGPLPKIKRVIWRIIPSAGTRRALMERGDADVSYDLPNKDFADLKSNHRLSLVSTPLPNGMQYIGMNVVKPPFDNLRVRQAVAYALPYQKIIDNVLFGLAKPLFGGNDAKISDIEWPRPSEFNTDLSRARKLLQEAGHADGFNTTLSFDLGLAVINEPLCVLIQENLQAIGIRATINKVPGSSWRAEMLKREMPMFIDNYAGWLDYPEYFFFYNYYSRNAIFNTSDYKSAEMDRLIDSARVTSAEGNMQQYEKDVRDFTKLAFQDLPRVPLFQPTMNIAMQKNISGYSYWSHRRLDYRPMDKA